MLLLLFYSGLNAQFLLILAGFTSVAIAIPFTSLRAFTILCNSEFLILPVNSRMKSMFGSSLTSKFPIDLFAIKLNEIVSEDSPSTNNGNEFKGESFDTTGDNDSLRLICSFALIPQAVFKRLSGHESAISEKGSS